MSVPGTPAEPLVRVGVGWATVSGLEAAPAAVPTLSITDIDRAVDQILVTTGSGSTGFFSAINNPSIALFRDGQLVHMLQRSDIEHRDSADIANELTRVFDEHCAVV